MRTFRALGTVSEWFYNTRHIILIDEHYLRYYLLTKCRSGGRKSIPAGKCYGNDIGGYIGTPETGLIFKHAILLFFLRDIIRIT